jgi:hypothetical protein
MSARVGKRGSVQHFLAAVRFGLTLWTVTHAVEYVRLATDILTFWHCASPALKFLYANEIMTQLTAYGDSIPQDEAMEKSVGHIFSKLGKIQKPGLEKKMEYQCATVPTRTTEMQSLKDLRGDTSETLQKKSRYHEYLSDNSPMVMLHEHLHFKMKLWHPVDDRLLTIMTKMIRFTLRHLVRNWLMAKP